MSSRPSNSDPARPATTDELLSHADWVRRLSRALLSDANEAEDVAQDAWVAALRRPPTAGDGLRGWWARVVRSTASNHRRSELRRTEREQRIASERTEATDPQIDTTLEAHRRLAAAIEALAEPLRGVIVAHYFHGASSREIAEREGVADSTIRTRLQKALGELRRELDERAGGERKAWAGLLAPLARLEHGALPAAAGAVVIAGWIKLAAGVAFVGLVGVAAYEVLTSRSVPDDIASSQPLNSPAAAQSLTVPAADSERKENAPAPVLAAAAEPVRQAEPFARVDAHVLDSHGLPIPGARLAYMERATGRECGPDEVPQARSNAGGLVSLAIRETDRCRGVGQRAGLPPGTWDAELEFTCVGHESRSLDATLVLGQSTSLGDVVLDDGADVSGRCLAQDGTPLPGARVELIHVDLSLADRRHAERGSFSRYGPSHRALCAANGSYSLPGVPVGHWRVSASAEGRTTAISEPFALAAAEELVLPDLLLTECTSAIRGTVLGLDGKPCAKAEIEYSFGARDECVGTQPEKDGSFVLTGFGSDVVDIYARTSRGDSGEAAVLGARPGEVGIVLRIPEPKHFEVRVFDPAGSPVEKYSVGIYCADGTGGGGSQVAPGGVCTCTARARPFRVTVLADGYAPLEQGLFTQQDVPAQLEFRLPASGGVRGRVLRGGAPQSYLEVHLDALLDEARQRIDGLPCLARPGLSAVTQADGSFGVGALSGGRHALWVQGRTGAIEYVRLFDIDFQHPVEGLDLDLDQTGSVDGRVEMDAQTCTRAAQILYTCGITDPRAERVAPDGTFRVAGLAPGRWWLRTARDTRTDSELLEPESVCDADCIALDVRAGETLRCSFDVRGSEKRLVAGRVTFGRSTPSGWVATLGGAARPFDRDSVNALSEVGEFTLIPRCFGPQILSLRSPGTPSRDDVIEAHVLVPADGLHWNLVCDLGTLEVEGKPSAQIQVLADLSNGATWTTHAILDANGRATLDSLPAAKVRVGAAGSKGSPVEVEIPAHGRAQARLP